MLDRHAKDAALYGDEFVVILSEMDITEDASSRAAKLLAGLAMPYEIGGRTLRVPVRIGISIYPDDGKTRKR